MKIEDCRLKISGFADGEIVLNSFNSSIFNLQCSIKSIAKFFIFYFLSFIFLFSGCISQQKIKRPSCPPLASTEQASASLGKYYAGLKPFKAVGSCALKFKDKKKQSITQSFPVRLWFESREKFCVYGDVFFDPKGLCFAVDGDDFWAYAKPISLYITGKKDEPVEENAGGAFFRPTVLLDFLNPLDTDSVNALLISSSNAIRCTDSKNHRVKKVYLDNCDKFVRKVEYLDRTGRASIAVELDNYKKVADGNFYFPHRLMYKYCKGRKCSDSMEIKLDSVKLWQPSDKQIEALFSRPDPNSFKKNGQKDAK